MFNIYITRINSSALLYIKLEDKFYYHRGYMKYNNPYKDKLRETISEYKYFIPASLDKIIKLCENKSMGDFDNSLLVKYALENYNDRS